MANAGPPFNGPVEIADVVVASAPFVGSVETPGSVLSPPFNEVLQAIPVSLGPVYESLLEEGQGGFDGPVDDHFAEVAPPAACGPAFDHTTEQIPPESDGPTLDFETTLLTLPGSGFVVDWTVTAIPGPFVPRNPATAATPEQKIPPPGRVICAGSGGDDSPGVCGREGQPE